MRAIGKVRSWVETEFEVDLAGTFGEQDAISLLETAAKTAILSTASVQLDIEGVTWKFVK